MTNESDVLGLEEGDGEDGAISEAMKSMKSLSIEEKKTIGPFANQVKQEMFGLFKQNLKN